MNDKYVYRVGCNGVVSIKGKKYLLPPEFRQTFGALKIYENGLGFYLVCSQGWKVYCQDVSSIDAIHLCDVRSR